jgi:hypothetical protein
MTDESRTHTGAKGEFGSIDQLSRQVAELERRLDQGAR